MHKTRTPLFLNLKHQKTDIFEKKFIFFEKLFSGKSLTVPKKKIYARRTLFFWLKTPMKVKGVSFDQVKFVLKKGCIVSRKPQIFLTIIEKSHHFHRIKKFSKNVSLCRKTQKRGPFGLFHHPVGCKKIKITKEDPLETFRGKVSQCRKKNS